MKQMKIKIQFQKQITRIVLLTASLGLSACAKNAQFAYTPQQDNFQQNLSYSAKKVDILWVVDNSGSMLSSQKALSENISRFMDQFSRRNLDFQMAVTTTDAYLDLFDNGDRSLLKNGAPKTGKTGHPLINRDTPNFKKIIEETIIQGTSGASDERAFLSLRMALNNPKNKGFLREGSYLAVIILSDEDDFSHKGDFPIVFAHDKRLEQIKVTTKYLDSLTRGDSLLPRFNVSAIGVLDDACLKKLNDSTQKVSSRYNQITADTNGVLGSLCDDFSKTLSKISGRILELATRFELSRKPDTKTIVVKVNGKVVAQDKEEGWTYDKESNSVLFHGEAVPYEGSNVAIDFTPTETKY